MQKLQYLFITIFSTLIFFSCNESTVFERGSSGARQIYFEDATAVSVGGRARVEIVIKDGYGTVDTSANGKIQLNVSGSASAIGLVEISSGKGTAYVTDNISETVTVSLYRSEITNLTLGDSGQAMFISGVATKVALSIDSELATGYHEVLTVQVQDNTGNKVSGIDLPILLTCSSATCFFYDLVTGAATNHVILQNGEGSVYVMDTNQGTAVIGVDGAGTNIPTPGFCGVAPAINCSETKSVTFGIGTTSGISIVTTGSQLHVGVCEKLVITPVGPGGAASTFPETTVVNLTTSSSADLFYSDLGCTQSTTIIGATAGSSGSDVYYKGNNIISLTLSATSSSLGTNPKSILMVDDDPISYVYDGDASTSITDSPYAYWTSSHSSSDFLSFLVEIRDSVGAVLASGTVLSPSMSAQSSNLSLTEGQRYYFYVKATDKNGYVSANFQNGDGWIVDNTDPVVTISAPTPTSVIGGTATFEITFSDNSDSFIIDKTKLENETTLVATGNAIGDLSFSYSNSDTDITQSMTPPVVTATISNISGFGTLTLKVPEKVLTDRVARTSPEVTGANILNVRQSNEIMLPNSTAVTGEMFGSSVDIYGSTIVTSSSLKADGDGQLSIYKIGDLSNPKIIVGDSGKREYFGKRVAIDGSNIVVSSTGNDLKGIDAGAVHLISYDNTALEWKKNVVLTAEDGGAEDYFGSSIAIDGDVIVVGAQGYDGLDDSKRSSGAVYVYRWNGTEWKSEGGPLIADDSEEWAAFGSDVAIFDDVIVVGASGDGGGIGAAYIFRWDGTNWIQKKKLTYASGKVGDLFGFSVAVFDGVIAVGAPGIDINSTDRCGSGFIYTYSGTEWDSGMMVTPKSCSNKLKFGSSIDSDDNVIIFGAPGFGSDDNGAAYVYYYENSSWQLDMERIITPTTENNSDNSYGNDVAISGNLAVIGARYGDTTGVTDSGAVYLYDGVYSNARYEFKSSDTTESFGASVSISRGIAAVGAPTNSDNGIDSGAAYLYMRDGTTWTNTKVYSDDIGIDDKFGYSVSAHGDMVAIGAPYNDDYGVASGSVYVFQYNNSSSGWEQIAKLVASDPGANSKFGESISLYQNKLLVGARGDDDAGEDSGSAYLFTYSNDSWTSEGVLKIMPGDHKKGDEFGASVSLAEDMIMIGSPKDDSELDNNSGKAYIYTLVAGEWIESRLSMIGGAANANFGKNVSISGGIASISHNFGTDIYYFDGVSEWTYSSRISGGDSTSNFGGMVISSSTLSFNVYSCDVSGCTTLPSQSISSPYGYGSMELKENTLIIGQSSDYESVYVAPIRIQ